MARHVIECHVTQETMVPNTLDGAASNVCEALNHGSNGGDGGGLAGRGIAVQVDPIKPTLKAPGTKRLKL